VSTRHADRKIAAILAADVAGYSRLMGVDEEGTLARLKAHRSSLIDPKIAEHRGRIVKTTGDGMLAVFDSVVEAVRCALDVQRGMRERNVSERRDQQIEFRVGLNIGDIIADEGDIFGDGVNIAARLQELAVPGGICLSRPAFDQIEGKLPFSHRKLGPCTLKNIARPIEVFAIDIDVSAGASQSGLKQKIGFCRAPDGVQLAYATVGSGPPLVKTANWMNHLEYDWKSPIWQHFLHGLAKNFTLYRYDERANGLSDWNVSEISFESFVSDLETVVDVIGLKRFPLLGISQGCPVAIAYALRHPERVSHLILYGGFAVGGMKRSAAAAERRNAIKTLMREGWGTENPAFRQIFTSQFIPDGTKEQFDWFNELQRTAISPENAVRVMDATGEIDLRDELAKVSIPTLVMHAHGDAGIPFELGRAMAAGIPGAQFVALDSRNHLLLEHEPAARQMLEEIREFVGRSPAR
jgi:class 3 adenylate cyclase/pimeloyl-ACP methyl ester carboxylesterase